MREPLARLAWLLAAVALSLPPAPVGAEEIGPEADWCAAIRTLAPGGELVLRPGDYPGPCTVRRGGSPDAPITIRAKDLAQRPRLVYLGREANVLNIRAGHLVIRGLEFGPTASNVDAIRIYEGDGVTIEDSRFADVGGIALVANHASLRGLTVRRNEIVQSKATALYFGCHDGAACVVSDLLVEQNYIQGVTAPADLVGYGVQVKLNSTAIIRDNVVVDTKGPGIMVYGARDPARASVVERNYAAGSRTSAGIVVGGGPVLVRNNVATGSVQGGILVEDYARRGLLRGVVVTHNTVHGNGQGGILVLGEGRLDVTIVNNAVHAPPGTLALPPGRIGVFSEGNVDCSTLPCFLAPHLRDFSPLVLKPGSVTVEAWAPPDDYFGRKRGVPPVVGAIEGSAGPLPLGIKASP